jgi:hypothetical protein
LSHVNRRRNPAGTLRDHARPPADWTALCALVFVLGLKHALDADHLAAIDGMTRLNAAAGRRLASWVRGAVLSSVMARSSWRSPPSSAARASTGSLRRGSMRPVRGSRSRSCCCSAP